MGKSVAEWRKMNDPVIAEFRRTAGRTSRKHPIILLTTTGAKTGRPLVTPLNFTEDGDRLAVIASSGGASSDPAWYRNLVANPIVTVEHGAETFRARASTAGEPERTRLFDRQVKAMPFFETYRRRVTAREIPVVILERLDGPAGTPGITADRGSPPRR